MFEAAGTKETWFFNVNTYFIPVPESPVHTVLKKLLITFTTRSRMTHENFRLCGSLPLLFGIHPACILTICSPHYSMSGWVQLVIYASEIDQREARLCTIWAGLCNIPPTEVHSLVIRLKLVYFN